MILDAGKDYKRKGPSAKPGGYAKHVALRADRADGFVVRNFLMRGALEFGFYTEETDGLLLDKTKFYWNADYGHLSFTTDHHVIQNCDGFGAGDAAVYPGAVAGDRRAGTSFYRDAPRANTVIRKCDLRGVARWATRARWATGCGSPTTTSTATPRASPATRCPPRAIPGSRPTARRSTTTTSTRTTSTSTAKNSPVKPLVATPLGTGIIYAGMNDARSTTTGSSTTGATV